MSSLHLDERNAVLHAQGGDQLLVHGLVAVLGQDAQQRLASADFKITVVCCLLFLCSDAYLTFVKRLGSLTDTSGKTVGDESLLQDLEFSLNKLSTKHSNKCW